MVLEQILAVGIPAVLVIGRNLFGYWQKYTSEQSEGGKKITSYEWSQLLQTFGRIGLMGIGVFFGLSIFPETAAQVSPEVATAIATLADLLRKGR